MPSRPSARNGFSGGKVLWARTKRSANRARQAFKMAAMSLSHSDSALGALYCRLCRRMDKPRVNTAVAHELARMVYFMLTRGQEYVDQGQQRYEDRQRQRAVAALQRRAAALSFLLSPFRLDRAPSRLLRWFCLLKEQSGPGMRRPVLDKKTRTCRMQNVFLRT